MNSAGQSLIGFDFYGAGNVGDDLMLAGFLGSYPLQRRGELACFLDAARLPSQHLRFPGIVWEERRGAERSAAVPGFRHWIGIGGTPFQGSSGSWLLKQALADVAAAPGQSRWMIGVGCEEEVLRHRDLARQLADAMDHIWTRDAESRAILVDELGVDHEKVSLGGDLAHLALSGIFPKAMPDPDQSGRLGIVYYEDRPIPANQRALRAFCKAEKARRPIAFLANEVRSAGFERGLYQRMFGGWRSLLGGGPGFFAPDYEHADLAGLVGHFRNHDAVMASRYHALLSAAWAGCRLAAFDRGSKIRFLAGELGIPLIGSPFTAESLAAGLEAAVRVPRTLLEAKAAAAAAAVADMAARMRA